MTDKAKKLAKIKDKINKLLALATSDNPNEAETAMRQAMSLMQKHAITEHDLDENDKTIIHYKYTSGFVKPPLYMLTVYNSVAKALGVYVAYTTGRTWLGKTFKATIHMVGQEADIKKAEYLYKVVYRLIEEKAQKYKSDFEAKNGFPLRRMSMNDYRAGVADGFGSAMIKAYEEAEKEMGRTSGQELVLADTRYEDAEAWFKQDHKVSYGHSTQRHSQHSANGFDDGKKLSVSEPIEGAKPQTLRLGNS